LLFEVEYYDADDKTRTERVNVTAEQFIPAAVKFRNKRFKAVKSFKRIEEPKAEAANVH